MSNILAVPQHPLRVIGRKGLALSGRSAWARVVGDDDDDGHAVSNGGFEFDRTEAEREIANDRDDR